jgi:hypothetical protein
MAIISKDCAAPGMPAALSPAAVDRFCSENGSGHLSFQGHRPAVVCQFLTQGIAGLAGTDHDRVVPGHGCSSLAQPLQMVPDPQGIGHSRQAGVHRAVGGKEAAIRLTFSESLGPGVRNGNCLAARMARPQQNEATRLSLLQHRVLPGRVLGGTGLGDSRFGLFLLAEGGVAQGEEGASAGGVGRAP